MKKSMTAPYAAIQAFYIMIYGGFGTFISAFLLPLGYSSTDIGLILSASNLVAIVLQPVLAAMASRKKGRPLYRIMYMLTVFELIACLPLLFVSKKTLPLTLLYVLLIAGHAVLSPLVNALSNRAKAHGMALNYGVCRGMGSAGYACTNALLGFLIPHVGTASLPATSLICTGGLLMTLLFSAKYWPGEDAVNAEQEAAEESWLSFFRNNKTFVVINLGCILLMFAQYAMQTYLLQIITPLGGGSSELGQILSFCGILELPAMFAFDSIRKKIRNNTLLTISMVGMLFKALLTYTAASVGMVYVAHAFQLIGFAMYFPAMIQYINENLDARSAIRAQTLFSLSTTFSGMAANFVGGILIDALGVPALGWVSIVTLVVGAAIILPSLSSRRKVS